MKRQTFRKATHGCLPDLILWLGVLQPLDGVGAKFDRKLPHALASQPIFRAHSPRLRVLPSESLMETRLLQLFPQRELFYFTFISYMFPFEWLAKCLNLY
jgi:hypothetical protein